MSAVSTQFEVVIASNCRATCATIEIISLKSSCKSSDNLELSSIFRPINRPINRLEMVQKRPEPSVNSPESVQKKSRKRPEKYLLNSRQYWLILETTL